ncbi:hypothetical protein [Pantoea allii]|uniref:hypothetical protein n=1 Tax=Pantoea allii TaxID=574096 RepID=UPI0024B71B8B|nr:hypothetical protein [Pantoea allii]MDJ0087676.1 hypothetical protein [Pantoea allii]
MVRSAKIAYLYLSDSSANSTGSTLNATVAFDVEKFPAKLNIAYRFGIVNISAHCEYRLDTRYYFEEKCIASPDIISDVSGHQAWYVGDLYASQMTGVDSIEVELPGYYSMVSKLMEKKIASDEPYEEIDKSVVYFAVSDQFIRIDD